MTQFKFLGAVAILSALVATPALAEHMIDEPGMYAFYHPNADLGIGPRASGSGRHGVGPGQRQYRSTENGAGVPSGAQARSVQQTLLICHRSGFGKPSTSEVLASICRAQPCPAERGSVSEPRDRRLGRTAQSSDLPVGQFVDPGVQPPLQKYSASPFGRNRFIDFRHPVPQEGRIAIVTDVGAGCGGRGSVLRAR